MLRYSQIWSTAGQEATFPIPNNCNIVYFTGCGGGGGGQRSIANNGAGGGNAAVCWLRIPLTVKPGGALGIHVGAANAGKVGTAANPADIYDSAPTVISGSALLSPFCKKPWTAWWDTTMGSGANIAGPTKVHPLSAAAFFQTNVFSPGSVVGGIRMASPFNPTAYKSQIVVVPVGFPFTGGEGTAGPSSNANSPLGTTDGRSTINGWGLGNNFNHATPDRATNGSIMGDSTWMDRPYQTYMSGDPGGGNMFGNGGDGGQWTYRGPGSGGNATGYGCGGGGGSGGGGNGGNGTGGLCILEW